VEEVSLSQPHDLRLGEALQVQARVALGELTPSDVSVEMCLGRVEPRGHLSEVEVLPMRCLGPARPGGVYLFAAEQVVPRRSGLHGFQVRVRPSHPLLAEPFEMGLVRWAG